MNQKNGKMKVPKAALVAVGIVLVGSIAAIASKDPIRQKSNDRYVRGWIDDAWVTLSIPNDTSFKLEPEMLLVKQKRSKDTIHRIANFSYLGVLEGDTNVLSVRTLTHVSVVPQ